MSSLALVLVIVAAVCHAVWNLWAKKAGGGPIFVWLFMTLSSLVLVPLVTLLLILQQRQLTAIAITLIAGTSLIHLIYFVFLQRAYAVGDLSLVYPLARGLGPTLATAWAVVVFGERPTFLALSGLVMVLVGIVLLTWRPGSSTKQEPRNAVYYGVMTGILISAYTVWDKYAVSVARVSPLALEAGAGLGISLMLTPRAIRNWTTVVDVWNKNRFEVIGVAILAPLAYILVLTAMAFTPLSYIAPAREISILFAALLGTHFLRERYAFQRVLAALSMMCGILALAYG